ncbi:excisionase family DNA-binding protein [Flexithrix dorotheae]|uniref:excisionase family DNA-binding protein n=1 Tax=Flexithrix dorotheae TaxID=70993 RepID=UPI00036A81B3|nr:excisionase family DNA-binding protein [Flexithrix dorotheae]
MEVTLKDISKKEQELAKKSFPLIQSSQSKKGKSKQIAIKIKDDQQEITIPTKAMDLLLVILQNMAEGNPVTILPSQAELTTQQAADLLNISRPYLVKLLESGGIPFKKTGSHRKILLSDILVYKNNLNKNRLKQLNFLAKQAQELNLGY